MNTKSWKEIKDEVYGEKGTERRDELEWDFESFKIELFLNNGFTELAYETGYYDQSHFINEVKELTGQTPKKLFENGEIISDFFR